MLHMTKHLVQPTKLNLLRKIPQKNRKKTAKNENVGLLPSSARCTAAVAKTKNFDRGVWTLCSAPWGVKS